MIIIMIIIPVVSVFSLSVFSLCSHVSFFSLVISRKLEWWCLVDHGVVAVLLCCCLSLLLLLAGADSRILTRVRVVLVCCEVVIVFYRAHLALSRCCLFPKTNEWCD